MPTPSRHAREYQAALSLLLGCRGMVDGNPGRGEVDQFQHALLTASHAERDGASKELIVAALLHDVAKPLSETHHAAIAAEMLREYVSEDTYHILRVHGEFQTDLVHGTAECVRYWREPWYATAVRFCTWDGRAFSPDQPVPPLERYIGAMRRMYRIG